MRLKKCFLAMVLIFMITSIAGCTRKQEEKGSLVEENMGLIDSVTIDEELRTESKLTLVELKDLLEKSSSIEVKNLDNQIIGKISSGEKIGRVVEDLFTHTILDEYKSSAEGRLIGTISFYPASNEPIYGLIKDRFIYIEDYYFIGKDNSIQKIVNYFQTNSEDEPIVGD